MHQAHGETCRGPMVGIAILVLSNDHSARAYSSTGSARTLYLAGKFLPKVIGWRIYELLDLYVIFSRWMEGSDSVVDSELKLNVSESTSLEILHSRSQANSMGFAQFDDQTKTMGHIARFSVRCHRDDGFPRNSRARACILQTRTVMSDERPSR